MSSSTVCQRAFNHLLRFIHASNLHDGIIGLGSGSTVAPLASLLRQLPPNFRVVPTSRQALLLILQYCPERLLPLEALDGPVLVTVDGADAVDVRRRIVVKGGGGCHVQEKVVAEASLNYCIVVNDSSKLCTDLSNVTVPVEVIPYAANILLNCHLPAILPPPASFALRHSAAGKGKAGPVVTDNGNLVIDARLGDDRLFDDCDELERRLRRHAGVVGTGIFMVPSGTIVFEGDENTFEL